MNDLLQYEIIFKKCILWLIEKKNLLSIYLLNLYLITRNILCLCLLNITLNSKVSPYDKHFLINKQKEIV